MNNRAVQQKLARGQWKDALAYENESVQQRAAAKQEHARRRKVTKRFALALLGPSPIV